MESKPHLEAFRQWIGEAKQLETQLKDSQVLTEQEIIAAKTDLLMRGKKAIQDFRDTISQEDASTAHMRAVGRNIWKRARSYYGEEYNEACSVHNGELLPMLQDLEKAIAAPIAAVRQKLQDLSRHGVQSEAAQ